MERTDTQERRISAWLEAGKSITPMIALEEFGCMRLGARIWELKHRKGMAIRREMIEVPGGARVASYSLMKEGEE